MNTDELYQMNIDEYIRKLEAIIEYQYTPKEVKEWCIKSVKILEEHKENLL